MSTSDWHDAPIEEYIEMGGDQALPVCAEQRRDLRFRIDGTVRVRRPPARFSWLPPRAYEAQLLDLGRYGIGLRGKIGRFRPGELVELTIGVDGYGFAAQAIVKHCDSEIMGAEFTVVPDRLREFRIQLGLHRKLGK